MSDFFCGLTSSGWRGAAKAPFLWKYFSLISGGISAEGSPKPHLAPAGAFLESGAPPWIINSGRTRVNKVPLKSPRFARSMKVRV